MHMGDGRIDRARRRTSEIKTRVPELRERVPELKERVPELTDELRHRGTELRTKGSELRSRGIPTAPTVRKNWDSSGALGGPILRDRFWFFGNVRTIGIAQVVAAGMAPNLNLGDRPAQPCRYHRAGRQGPCGFR